MAIGTPEHDNFPYRSLFETSIDGILLVTTDGSIFGANQAACAILGRTPDEITGSAIESILDPSDAQSHAALAELGEVGQFHGELTFLKNQQLPLPEEPDGEAGDEVEGQTQVTQVLADLRTTGKLPGDIDLLRADSPYFPVDVSCAMHTMEDGSRKISIIFRDATERKQMLEALRELAVRDELTALYNRREMINILQEAVRQAALRDGCASLVMIDLDHFKTVNDTYGHQAGDEVLRQVGQLIRGEIRASDRAARYGGEEFSLILPATSGEEAFVVAEGLRETVSQHVFSVDTRTRKLLPMSVTVSMGVATFPADAITEEGLLAAADRALYGAKRQGRNCVMASSSEPLNTGSLEDI
ncbi:MAG: sensor domain-containing diguanylate cyclase [Chloroflexota bacterium]|nr:sensor domain-containing diguanylate cyclase [Chloroflexota bacterium]